MSSALTEDQLELLRSLPRDISHDEYKSIDAYSGAFMDYIYEDSFVFARRNPEAQKLFVRRNKTGDTLLATIDAAREDERRRIDGLAEKFVRAGDGSMECYIPSPTGDDLWTVCDMERASTGATFTDALAAATTPSDRSE